MNLVDGWRRVMDVRYNLKIYTDPSLQTYFMLVLFIMWSVFFGFLAASYLGWFGYNTVVSIIIHCAILIPIGIYKCYFCRCRTRWTHMVEGMERGTIKI